ncbi:MAG: DDE-type integrase/transposase/recombinase [Desulfobacteraceae bacterium]|nr:DDE-type integrase/transposase/recombinase [Desulfobacteraceae bacterium]
MKETALTGEKIAELKGVGPRAIRKRAQKENWPFAEETCRGGKVRLYALEALPDDIRLLYNKVGMEKAVQGNLPGSAQRHFEPAVIPVGSPELSERQNRVALARADLVRLYLMEKKKAKAERKSKTLAAEDFIAGYNTGLMFPALFETLGQTSVKTVERWALAFKRANHDYTVIADNYGNRRGECKITQEEVNAALSFALHPNRLKPAQIARMTKLALSKRQIPSTSSASTITRFLDTWSRDHYDIWVLRREGQKAYNDKVAYTIQRDAGLLSVGEVLVADGHQLNFDILNPFTGKPGRMAMVLWYDWASRYPVGWEIMPTENTQCIASALRRAIQALGKMPDVAYLDNGRAFKSRIFNDKNIDFEAAGFFGMFARLGMETVFAWAYHGQSKPVERFFGTFDELERIMPTFTGASIADKPARLMRNEVFHQKMHEKMYGGWVPTIAQASHIIAGWVAEYAQRPHRGLKGLCPAEVFEAGKGPGVDPERLSHLMMDMKIKSVGRSGIRFLGRDYYDEVLHGYRQPVMIRYDLEDVSCIHVYDRTGSKKICTARPIEGVHPMARILGGKEDVALLESEIKKKRRLEKQTREAVKALESPPALVTLPENTGQPLQIKPETKKITRAEAEHLEAEAARMEIIEFKPKAPERVFIIESDKYEALLERECKGEALDIDAMQFMRYYEKTAEYLEFKERFEFMREVFIAGPEDHLKFQI